jgi:ribosomal protein S18 acetylase RimI-like enzyme
MARLHRGTIRHINSKDYPEDAISAWSGRTSTARFRSSAKKVKRWVAVVDEKVVGFCDHNFKCELGGLYTHKDFQGKGVGKKLMEKAEASMKKQGCKKIKIQSTITAKGFYQKMGYKVIKKSFHRVNDKKLEIFIMSKAVT